MQADKLVSLTKAFKELVASKVAENGISRNDLILYFPFCVSLVEEVSKCWIDAQKTPRPSLDLLSFIPRVIF